MRKSQVVGGADGGVSSFIALQLSENAKATVEEMASKLQVFVARKEIEYSELDGAMKSLKKLRVSPALQTRVGVDNIPKYEFWYDTWQESVHYSLIGPPGKADQDSLSRWMTGFQEHLNQVFSQK